MDYTIAKHDEQTSITVFYDGNIYSADSTHPSLEKIREGALKGDVSIIDLFNPIDGIAEHFNQLSERVSVGNGRIYFDGDEIDNALTKQIVRFLDEGEHNWYPLVRFLEKVQQNPNPESVKELYTWLERNDFAITDDGDIVAYKGVYDYYSNFTGRAIVDGEVVKGHIPNRPNSVIEMPRSQVLWDPHQSCAVGLHAANYSFARGWGNHILEIHVNPRDIVSVPHHDTQKMRVCRYYISREVTEEFSQPLKRTHESASESNPCTCGDSSSECECNHESDYENADHQIFYPTQKEFNNMWTLAKQRKRGFVRTAKQKGWVLENEDAPDSRFSWSLPLA